MVTDKKTTPPQASEKSTSEPAAKKTAKTASEKPSATPKKPKENSPKAFPWIKTLLVFLLIGALGFAGWIGWAEWQTQQESRAGISESLQQDLAATERNLAEQQQLNRQTIQQQSQFISQLESQLKDQIYSMNLRLNSQAERILQLGTASRGDRLLS